MSDDKNKRGGADRRLVSAGQGYEIHYFAQKHGLSVQQARDMVRKVGNSRARLDTAAEAQG